ncbi:hypothetical protein LX36DRAFT_661981 [Colletotrichum falcatum]|nr:hypothetical protein LX36DRAFT_661981 [Colletotrichum falcatum]
MVREKRAGWSAACSLQVVVLVSYISHSRHPGFRIVERRHAYIAHDVLLVQTRRRRRGCPGKSRKVRGTHVPRCRSSSSFLDHAGLCFTSVEWLRTSAPCPSLPLR